ncbi:hypothetical protein MPSI1_002392 [Malassezia psittaci]|uniref:DNA-directed RNA polymerase III subunit n=1 Tax=Malassezia psittaci TaxID=1821823 RepID=A0AAF0F6Q5_9BASI|nr:hypothetical protein MPSI1_002392 [Malassezia psittaci]
MASSGRGGRVGGPGSRSGPMTLFQGSGLVYTEGVLEDEMDQDLVFEPPTEMERVIAQKQLHLIQQQIDSAYWVRQPALRAEDREVPRYTDRYQPDRLGTGSVASLLNHSPLNQAIFPPSLWAKFTSNEAERVGEPRRTRRAAEINWDNLHAEENRTGDAEEDQRGKSDEDHLDEYEDEDEDDYAQNYFDNGEDDDEDMDDGGGGDEAAFD